MIHKSLPQTKTPEALAGWILDQQKDKIEHLEKFPLTPEEIQKLEHDSAAASSALYRLKDVEELFKSVLKSGTTVVHNEKGEPEYQPYDITIPPTKGTKSLEFNRKFADDQLKAGFRFEITNIYMVPWPEEGKMIGVEITGKEWPQYTRDMTTGEINANKPLLKEDRVPGNPTFSVGDVIETGDGDVLDTLFKGPENPTKGKKKTLDSDPFI